MQHLFYMFPLRSLIVFLAMRKQIRRVQSAPQYLLSQALFILHKASTTLVLAVSPPPLG